MMSAEQQSIGLTGVRAEFTLLLFVLCVLCVGVCVCLFILAG